MTLKSKKLTLDLLVPVFLVFLWMLLYYKVIFFGNTFVLMDSSRFFYPLWKWGAQIWKNGLIPLWNPSANFGTPYLADPQMAVWYPPLAICYWLFSPSAAFKAIILFHHLLAILGFWFFARGRKFSSVAACSGSLIFGFSFNAIMLAWAPIMLFTYSWIPWVFGAAYGLAEKRKGSFFLLTVFLALQMASGYPVFCYLTLITLALDWFLRWFVQTESELPGLLKYKEAGTILLAVLLGLSYNLAWLIPFKEFTIYSDLSNRTQITESLKWEDLGTWLNPFLKGHPLHAYPETPYSVTVYFCGFATFALILWGTAFKKIGWTRLTLFLVLMVLSLGETAGVGGWLKNILPAYGFVVRSGYWIPLVIWVSALLVLETIEKLLSSKFNLSLFEQIGWCLIVFFAFVLSLGLGVPWILWVVWGSFSLALLAGMAQFLSVKWRSVFLLTSIILSLGPVARSLCFTMPEDYYEVKPSVFSFFTKSGRLYHPPVMVDRYQTVSGKGITDIYEKIKAAIIPNWPLGFDLEETCFANTLFLNSSARWYFSPPGGSANLKKNLDYLDVRYAFGEKPGSNWREMKTVDMAEPLWENQKTLSKWFSIKKTLLESNLPEDWIQMRSPLFDFDKNCLVSYENELMEYSPRKIHETFRTVNQVNLFAEGSGDAFLASSETAYPGWRAKVGNQWRTVERINDGFLGIRLKDGEEGVSIVYRPTSFKIGFFLSALTVGFLFFLFLNYLFQKGN